MCNKVSFIYYTSFNLITKAILNGARCLCFYFNFDSTSFCISTQMRNERERERKGTKNYLGFFKRIIKVTINFLLAVVIVSVCIFLELISSLV